MEGVITRPAPGRRYTHVEEDETGYEEAEDEPYERGIRVHCEEGLRARSA